MFGGAQRRFEPPRVAGGHRLPRTAVGPVRDAGQLTSSEPDHVPVLSAHHARRLAALVVLCSRRRPGREPLVPQLGAVQDAAPPRSAAWSPGRPRDCRPTWCASIVSRHRVLTLHAGRLSLAAAPGSAVRRRGHGRDCSARPTTRSAEPSGSWTLARGAPRAAARTSVLGTGRAWLRGRRLAVECAELSVPCRCRRIALIWRRWLSWSRRQVDSACSSGRSRWTAARRVVELAAVGQPSELVLPAADEASVRAGTEGLVSGRQERPAGRRPA